jgi:hypothetical protein
VALIDRFALAASRRFIDQRIAQVTGEATPEPAPNRPVRAFISYRTAYIEIAQRLHSALQSYEGGAFVEPILDRHELKAGELVGQLRGLIETSDAFIALATQTYAEPETYSARELEDASELGRPILPILIAGTRPKYWPEWKKWAIHEARDFDALLGADSIAVLVTMCVGIARIAR